MNVELKRDGLTLRGELLLPEKDSYDISYFRVLRIE